MQQATRPQNVAATSWEKFDAGLREEASRAPGDAHSVLPVMISIARPPNAASEGDTGTAEARFVAAAREALDQLRQAGAEKVEPLWINWTISAAVDLATLNRLGQRSDVTKVLLVKRFKAVC